MALLLLLGRGAQTSVHLHIKPNPSFWGPIRHSLWYPLSSSSSSSSSLRSRRPSVSFPVSQPCSGTCLYEGAQQDDWIMTLAQFAVDKHNQNENTHLKFMRVVGASHTKPVDDSISALGVKRGGVKLHEAVMFYMNQMK